MTRSSPLEDLRKIKQNLGEAVREADAAVEASMPTKEELVLIKANFDKKLDSLVQRVESLERSFQAKPRPVRAFNPNVN